MVLAAASLLLLTVGWLWMGARQATRRVAAFGDELWRGSRSSEAAAPAAFFESHLAEQPEVVQRYFRWSLRDGTPPARAARLELTGRIRLGRGRPWMPHRSEETIRVGDGFVWTARVAGQFPITGADIYVEGRGEMAWRLAGLLPVMRAADPDITRSARWRFVAEHFFLPGALLPGDRVLWTPLAPHRARISIEEDGIVHLMTVDFHPEGMPRQISLLRWGDFETEGGNWREIPYAVRCEGVFRNGGYSLPHQYTASWWAGTDRELSVVELEIVKAEFR
jgi:hypothetical protein